MTDAEYKSNTLIIRSFVAVNRRDCNRVMGVNKMSQYIILTSTTLKGKTPPLYIKRSF